MLCSLLYQCVYIYIYIYIYIDRVTCLGTFLVIFGVSIYSEKETYYYNEICYKVKYADMSINVIYIYIEVN